MKPKRIKPAANPLSPVDALVQLSFRVQSVLGRVAAEYDLSIIQVRMLGVLRGREPSMMELGAFLELDKSSITGLVDRAERRGLVKRSTNADDRRAVNVMLTERGQATAATFVSKLSADLGTLTSPLSSTAKAKLTELAQLIIEG